MLSRWEIFHFAPDFDARARSVHIFTSSTLCRTNVRYLTSGIFDRISREESGCCAGDQEVAIACPLGGLISGVNPRPPLVACADAILPALFSFEPTTLQIAAGSAFSKRSPVVCLASVRSSAFAWCSWSATIRAAKATGARRPVATQVVLRLNLLSGKASRPSTTERE
jgi:hypothetical protein